MFEHSFPACHLNSLTWAIIGLVVFIVLSGLVLFAYSSLRPQFAVPASQGGFPEAAIEALPQAQPEQEQQRKADEPLQLAPDRIRHDTTKLERLIPLVLALVEIVAIVAVYLIARQAIAAGQNVEITWKVTEKAAGMVVITKVPVRPARRKGDSLGLLC